MSDNVSRVVKAATSLYGQLVRDLGQAQNLLSRDRIDDSEKQRLGELAEALQHNFNIVGGLLLPEQRNTLETLLDSYKERFQKQLKPEIADSQDYLLLKNITATAADGAVIESYPDIKIAKGIVRGTDGKQTNFTPYNGILYFENQGLFLPSFALSCNILAELYKHKDDAEINKVLMQYKDKGNGTGWHAQNTIVDWKNRQIIHYPSDNDFPQYGGNSGINKERKRIVLDFNPEKFADLTLEKALQRTEFDEYLKNLTGLQDPSILISIGQHFNKTARIWVPNNPKKENYTSSAWLCCDYYIFNINTYNNLYYSYAARGVFL